jgi:hypothetical protein
MGERLLKVTALEPCAVPEFIHKPVMAAEVLGRAEAEGGRRATPTARSVELVTRRAFWRRVRRLDGCLGAIAMASRLKPPARGWRKNLPGRFEIRRGNFSELAEWIPAASCDGRVAGSGREFAATGFAGARIQFSARRSAGHADGSDSQPLTAADLVNERETPMTLANIFWEFGGERIRGGLRNGNRARPRGSENLKRRGSWRRLLERLSPRAEKRRIRRQRFFKRCGLR